MSIRTVTASTLLLALLAGCAAERDLRPEPDAAPAGEPRQTPSSTKLRDRQLIVTLADPAPESWLRWQLSRAIASDYGLREVGDFPLQSIGVHCVVYDLVGPHAIDPQALDGIVRRLSEDPRVESAQPNQEFFSLADASREGYSRYQYGLASIGADRAHAKTTGKGVMVAVIDTGMDTRHRDLRGRVRDTRSFVKGGDKDFAQDSHGTAVGGIIAALADEVGIVGVAPDAGLLALKACKYRESSSTQARCSSWSLSMAIDFALRSDARVINLSLSGPSDPLVARLIAHAITDDRVVVAAASRTRNGEPSFPASLDEVIGVVSSDIEGQVEPIGWYKRANIVAAPGEEVLTTAPGQSYGFQSGSSLAAAHVSGVLALMFEAAPALSADSAARLINATTQPLIVPAGSSTTPTVGLVDACAALQALGACG